MKHIQCRPLVSTNSKAKSVIKEHLKSTEENFSFCATYLCTDGTNVLCKYNDLLVSFILWLLAPYVASFMMKHTIQSQKNLCVKSKIIHIWLRKKFILPLEKKLCFISTLINSKFKMEGYHFSEFLGIWIHSTNITYETQIKSYLFYESGSIYARPVIFLPCHPLFQQRRVLLILGTVKRT